MTCKVWFPLLSCHIQILRFNVTFLPPGLVLKLGNICQPGLWSAVETIPTTDNGLEIIHVKINFAQPIQKHPSFSLQ